VSGICGLVRWDGQPVFEADLHPMLDAAGHRGPDGRGAWVRDGAGFGFLALEVTPEARHESQPLWRPELGLVLVADARIDNRTDLLGRLSGLIPEGPGPVTDASLILAAYRKWGADCPRELVGDFAFAVWDTRERRLFAARDPMGMRSLYFLRQGPVLRFSSEVAQLLDGAREPVRVFEPAIAVYLAGGFGPPEWTAYRDVKRIPAGHALRGTQDGTSTHRFWEPDPDHRIIHRSDGEYADHFGELLRESVRARLRTAHPVGLLLSGGIDSGAIAATAGWLLSHESGVSVPEFRAYSFAWNDLTECDERHISEPIARHFGFPVTDVPADDAWPLRDYPDGGPAREGPFLFGHHTLLDRAFRLASGQGTRLMLSGDRGDLVGGMGIYDFPGLLRRGRWLRLLQELRMLAHWRGSTLRRQLRRESLKVARESGSFRRLPWRLLPGAKRIARVPPPRIPPWLNQDFVTRNAVKEHLGPPDPAPRLEGFAKRERYRAIFAPLHLYGVAESERMHARQGQGFADPWSDRRLVEFVLAVPQRVLNRPDQHKRLTRMALESMLPRELVAGMTKIVPTPLFDRGLRERERGTIEALLGSSEGARQGYWDAEALTAHYRRLVTDPRLDPTLFWRALSVEMWLRAHPAEGAATERSM
jgi:asparagine synthase (glutamine-hydrolysing)